MILYKNVDICDLESILKTGILSLDESGNDNWETGHRAKNTTDKVYLFSPLPGQDNSFPSYGLALLMVDCDADPLSTQDNDFYKDCYKEFVTDRVLPEQILKIYVPEVFKHRLKEESTFEKMTFVPVKAKVFSHIDKENNIVYRYATQSELKELGNQSALNAVRFSLDPYLRYYTDQDSISFQNFTYETSELLEKEKSPLPVENKKNIKDMISENTDKAAKINSSHETTLKNNKNRGAI